MVGVKPVPDALGRVNKLEVVPLAELGRPRVDVVVNCSGVFRDLFVNQMLLLDRAVKLAAELVSVLRNSYVSGDLRVYDCTSWVYFKASRCYYTGSTCA